MRSLPKHDVPVTLLLPLLEVNTEFYSPTLPAQPRKNVCNQKAGELA